MTAFKYCAVAGIAMFVTSGSAPATTIIATFDSMTPQQAVTVTLPSGSTNTSAGRFNFTRTDGSHPENPVPDAPVSHFWAFSVELGQEISFGDSITYEVEPLASGSNVIGGIGATKANQILELLGVCYPDFSQVLANDQYAALQLAIWEITREDDATFGFNVVTGQIKFAGIGANVLNLANTWLAQVDGIGPRAQRILALTNHTSQDMLVQFPVPETGSLGLALLGLAGLGFTRRRKA